MSFQIPPAGLLLSRLLVAGTLLSCFAIVLGAGELLKSAPQRMTQSDSATIGAPTPAMQSPPIAASSLDPSWFAAELVAVSQQMGEAPARAANPDSEPPAAAEQDPIVGIWAPDARSCSFQNFKDGLLPTVINRDGATAGDTFCGFRNQRQTDTGWRMDALCTNKQERWTTHVHLIIKGDRLIWKSKRGSQAYTRCISGVRMADSH